MGRGVWVLCPRTQTPESDVDVVVYQKALTEELSPGRLYLEDVLPCVWNRRMDIIRVELCSRTVYGSARDEEVLRLRRRASKTLDSGRDHTILFRAFLFRKESTRRLDWLSVYSGFIFTNTYNQACMSPYCITRCSKLRRKTRKRHCTSCESKYGTIT